MEENKSELFLDKFKQLEKKLISLSNSSNNFIGFSRALEECRNKKIVPILLNNDIYNFLRTASDLRNILSHQSNVCIPSTQFYNKFKIIAEEIINPLEVYDICTTKDKIIYAAPGTSVLKTVNLMVENHLSHVPVIEKGKVVGVFSNTTFFNDVYTKKGLQVDDSYVIKDYVTLKEYSNYNDNFIFTSRHTKAYSLIKYLVKRNPQDKKVSVIFITEHGKEDEELIGILTPVDFLRSEVYSKLISR